MDNILSDNLFDLDRLNPQKIARNLAHRVKQRRLELNITQEELSRRSGVSFGSVKRFENTGKISLQYLLMLAAVLEATDDFSILFVKKNYQNMDEVMKESIVKKRKRAR